eukprot:TRINITY_DN5574_c0_g1_i1.p1 TRINITY_DN5574_c0_g1~~TRINITY_DN5574_c0_g1_i1.p1  ORF type:complete len:590 (+),score=226.79 TRINITY_DN5574_c0_g1_i1:78-1847(+)
MPDTPDEDNGGEIVQVRERMRRGGGPYPGDLWVWLLVLIRCAVGAPLFEMGTPEASEGWGPEFCEHFYAVNIRGSAGGLMRSAIAARRSDGGGWELRSVEEMEARVDRGSNQVQLRFSTVVIENEAGAVLEAGYTQKMAQDKIRMRFVFPPPDQPSGKVEVTSLQRGQEHRSSVPGPGTQQYLGRVAALRYFGSHLHALGTPEQFKVLYRTVKPEIGPAVTNVSSKLLIREVEGKAQTVSQWETFVEGVGLNSTEQYNSDPAAAAGLGHPPEGFPSELLPPAALSEYRVNSPFGMLEAVLMDEGEARRRMREETNRPELVMSAYVEIPPDERLRAGDAARSVSYRITPKSGGRPKIPSAGFQRAEDACEAREVCSSSGNEVLVTVDLDAPLPATPEEVAQREQVYLSATAMVDATAEPVKKLAAEALAGALASEYGPPSPRRLAEACWQVARRTIQHSDLATGFASASETARTGQGDCSEFAVLLAALLRANGIPSRVASGLVYLDGWTKANFGWHMWTQAMLPEQDNREDPRGGTSSPRWVDFDATLPVPFSVGHVLLGTTALTDAGAHSEELKLVALIGNLKVVVED